jgi:putative Mn2+ efflux pump MntP
VLTLIAAAFAAGAGNFSVAVSIGMSDATAAMRWRIAAVFGVFEGGMPLVGLILGDSARKVAGGAGGYIGGALLIAVGGWQLLQATRSGGDHPLAATGTLRLLVVGFALSIDNLLVGFSIGIRPVSLTEAVAVFTVVSVTVSLGGFELGKRIGSARNVPADCIAGSLLVAVGVLVAAGWI